MLCVSLPLRAAGALCLSGYLCLEWERCHGWLMNARVSIAVPDPRPHHRDIHSPSPPQVSEGCTGILGPDPERSVGTLMCRPSLTTTVVSELLTERSCVERTQSSRGPLRAALWGL